MYLGQKQVNNIKSPLYGCVFMASGYVSVKQLKGRDHINSDYQNYFFFVCVRLFFQVLIFTPLTLTVSSSELQWQFSELHAETQIVSSAKETCRNSRKFFGCTHGHTQTNKNTLRKMQRRMTVVQMKLRAITPLCLMWHQWVKCKIANLKVDRGPCKLIPRNKML